MFIFTMSFFTNIKPHHLKAQPFPITQPIPAAQKQKHYPDCLHLKNEAVEPASHPPFFFQGVIIEENPYWRVIICGPLEVKNTQKIALKVEVQLTKHISWRLDFGMIHGSRIPDSTQEENILLVDLDLLGSGFPNS